MWLTHALGLSRSKKPSKNSPKSSASKRAIILVVLTCFGSEFIQSSQNRHSSLRKGIAEEHLLAWNCSAHSATPWAATKEKITNRHSYVAILPTIWFSSMFPFNVFPEGQEEQDHHIQDKEPNCCIGYTVRDSAKFGTRINQCFIPFQ